MNLIFLEHWGRHGILEGSLSYPTLLSHILLRTMPDPMSHPSPGVFLSHPGTSLSVAGSCHGFTMDSTRFSYIWLIPETAC